VFQISSHPVRQVKITRIGQELVVVLPELEAKVLMQTCALVVTSVHAHPELTLPPQMQTVLCQLFSGLKNCSNRSKESQG
jgi:hypothetical protein